MSTIVLYLETGLVESYEGWRRITETISVGSICQVNAVAHFKTIVFTIAPPAAEFGPSYSVMTSVNERSSDAARARVQILARA